MIANSGQSVEPDKKPKIGVLMLDTRFPRLLGDIGNPKSIKAHTFYRVVKGASPHEIVRNKNTDLIEPFINAAKEMIEEGAQLITTSCGFLVYFQQELENALCIPVITSSLLLFPILEKKYGEGNVGILTIAASSLTNDIKEAAKIPLDTPVKSTEGGMEFTSAILENRMNFDVKLCEEDNVRAAIQLQNENPNIEAILLECTNMPPHKKAIEKATGLKVYSIMDGINESYKYF